jgi:hypothetical protein
MRHLANFSGHVGIVDRCEYAPDDVDDAETLQLVAGNSTACRYIPPRNT